MYVLQIDNDDTLPQNICSSCLREIIQIHLFKEKCKQNEIFLRTLSNTHIKDDNEIKDTDNYCENTDNDPNYNSNEDSDTPEIKKPRPTRKTKTRRRKKIVSNSEAENYNCRDCSETFNSRDELKAHRKAVKHSELRNHACETCGKTFTRSKLRQHMRAHTKEKPYKCKICSQAFSMSGNLNRHMMTHTGERPHVCQVCGKGKS